MLEVLKSVIPCVTNEGVWVHGAAHEELVCEVVEAFVLFVVKIS
jgi:hypothetical protein